MNIQGLVSHKFSSRRRIAETAMNRRGGSSKKSKFVATLRTRRLALESLELRKLMAAEIFGTIYEDVDRSGTKTGGDNGLSGWTVFLDINKDGALNAGEPSAVTNVDGDYSIKGLEGGNYRVAEVLQPGWTPISPTSNDVSVATNKQLRSDSFVFGGGDISGVVWSDVDHDGVRSSDPLTGEFTDPALSGWTIYLDLDSSRTLGAGEPTTVTDANGAFRFEDLAPGDYEVTEVLPAGWEASKKHDIRQTATVFALKETVSEFGNFSLTNGGIRGTVFNDLNADGIRNTELSTGKFSEPGLGGWTVFIDLNHNLIKDGSDIVATTDRDGEYNFLSLNAGDYDIIEMLPSGWSTSPGADAKQTVGVVGSEITVAADFANFTVLNGSISGLIWNDVNRNSVRDFNTLTGQYTDPPIAGWSVFVDLNRDRIAEAGEPIAVTDASGRYSFLDLQVGDYEVREILPAGWEVAATFSDSQSVTVFSGADSMAHDFANYNASASSPGSVSGVIWNDHNGNGLHEVAEAPLTGWTVFLDLNSNGVLDTGESQVSTPADGSYAFSGVTTGTVSIGVVPTVGWRATAPAANSRSLTLKGGQNATGLDFGEVQLKDASISGVVFADASKNGVRDVSEHGLAGITVYLDLNNNKQLDFAEPSIETSSDQFYTPAIDEAGDFSFTHLALGTYVVRTIVPELLSATPAMQLEHTVTIAAFENRTGVNTAAVYRPNEIRGVKFVDSNGNHARDTDEPAISEATIFVDMNRNDVLDEGEPTTTTATDGSYSFVGLVTGSYVVRSMTSPGYSKSSPTTTGGTLWPTGTSNVAIGNVTPSSIEASLAKDQIHRQTVSITLPNTGALTDLVDVFLLFDDTGSFVNNSPIVRAAFPTIIAQLQATLPGIDLGFGVGRFEEYANFAYEYSSGRPFILNQPIVAASTTGYMTSIQAALNRTTPGYGGDGPETDIEALYQLVTGKGFDGNNNGTVLDSGPAGPAATQLSPGISGDVPSFASFTPDPANSVLPAAGNVGGAGFRSGALPIVLLATDIGLAYQPKGELTVTGAGGVSLPVSSLTQTSRATTPYNSGAGLQETITGLNALGALVIGLGTNPVATVDPRQQLEAISKLTGATNQTTTTIANGTADPIAPGDPFYFQIASGFGASVANGVVSAIQNAVTNVAVDIEVRTSDPRVRLVNHTGIAHGIGSGMTASFDIEFIGDGAPRRFDLQFVRAGTNVVLGSIPVVLGTPISGDYYQYDELDDGEIEIEDDFGDVRAISVPTNAAPSFAVGANISEIEDAGAVQLIDWATSISPGPAADSTQALDFVVINNNSTLFSAAPAISPTGTLTFTPAANASGLAVVTVTLHDDGGTANGGVDISSPQFFTITITPVNDTPLAKDDNYSTSEDTALVVSGLGVLGNDVDIDSSTLTSVLVLGPAHGTVTLNSDGSFTYIPTANFNGADRFTYKANDGLLDSNIATVTLTVTPVNNAPVAADDSYSTEEDTALVVPGLGVLGNDIDIDSSTLTSVLVLGPAHGTVTLNSDGSFTYIPTANFSGADSFTYKANDGLLDSNIATVRISVVAVNDAPMAKDDNYLAISGAAETIAAPGVLQNDTDVDSPMLSTVIVSPPAHGTVTLSANGSFTYLSVVGYTGTDEFTYVANDGTIDSNIARVSIVVSPALMGNQFVVVDQKAEQTFQYDSTGTLVGQSALNKENENGRGIASSSDGSINWVVDKDSRVYVYSSTGNLLGSWKVNRVDKPEGITLSGADLWIVDNETDRAYYFAGAASKRSGEVNPTSSFALNRSNRDPMDIVTDGTNFWVVNDTSSVDSVFRYAIDGRLQGSWTIDVANTKPTGIAIDPSNLSDVWIADSGTDRVYQYAAGVSRISGHQSAARSFALDSQDGDPQGLSIMPAGLPSPLAARVIATPLAENNLLQSGARDVVEMGMVRIESKQGMRVDDAPEIDSIPHSIFDVALDELMVDNSDRRQWVTGDDDQHDDSYFSDLTKLSTDLELAIGDLVKGKLARLLS